MLTTPILSSNASDSVRVAIRVRPLSEKEISQGQTPAWKALGNSLSLIENRGYSNSTFTYGMIHERE